MKQTTLPGNIKVKEFESINELVKFYNNEPYNEYALNGSKSSQSGSYSFTGTQSFKEASDFLEFGWEGSEELNKKLKVANMNAKQTNEVKKAVYDIVGFQASVPRYLQGIPTNMVNYKTYKKKDKIVDLYKSCSYAAMVGADKIMQDSIKFIQIVQGLEAQGYRVNVNIAFGSRSHQGETCMYTIKLKKASERLNISKMAFSLVHPSFLRRIIFKTMEHDNDLETRFAGGYGEPQDHKVLQRHIGQLKKQGYVMPNHVNEYEATSFLQEIVKGAE